MGREHGIIRLSACRAKGATPISAAAWRLPIAPSSPIHAIRDAAVTGPMPGAEVRMLWLSAYSSAPAISSSIRRSYPRTPASTPSLLFGR